MDNKATVVVLMSTYNGEAHLEDQIKSILDQEGVNVRLIIRDDGSKDNTVSIARKYTDEIIEGENLGYRYSFLELIKNAPEADYYALSDQDDIWLPDKLITAVKSLQNREEICSNSKPALYLCNRMDLINGEHYEAKELRGYREFPFNAFNNGNHIQGCTMVMNRKLRAFLSSYMPYGLIVEHDVWIYQVCKSLDGVIIYNSKPFILYRIDNNQIGIPSHRKLKRLLALFKKKHESSIINLCDNLLNGFSDVMSLENRKICTLYKEYKSNKIKLLFTKQIYQGDLIHRLYLFFLIVFGAA